MKQFSYVWDDSIFLLHIQLTRPQGGAGAIEAIVSREYEGGKVNQQRVCIDEGAESHRFIVSRSHPREVSFKVEYPRVSTLEAFKIDDRAYYPTESFFVG
jgi:hypothetical protein